MHVKHGRTGVVLLGTTLVAVCGWAGYVTITRLSAGEAPGKAVGATNRVNAPLHPVTIKRPAGPPRVATGLTNFHGQPVMASCGSCHATTQSNIETRSTVDLDQFHQGLKYVHGNLTCLSCHNAKNYDTLRLADSRSVEFSDVMTVCSQCHGPQRRDYDMGLHGGMNGHWDLTKGGRTRNTCVNCHDPHAPAFPLVLPVFPPRDRISVRKEPTAKPVGFRGVSDSQTPNPWTLDRFPSFYSISKSLSSSDAAASGIVSHADQSPLQGHFLHSPQQKPPKSSVASRCSAGLQPAVSPICNRQARPAPPGNT